MPIRDMVLAALTSVVWGLAFVATKLALDSFSAAQLTAEVRRSLAPGRQGALSPNGRDAAAGVSIRRRPITALTALAHATALSLIAPIVAKSRVTRSSSKTWSGPVGAMSVKGGS